MSKEACEGTLSTSVPAWAAAQHAASRSGETPAGCMIATDRVVSGDAVHLARQRVIATAAAVQASEAFAHASTLAALAGAAVACRALPPKLNGVVQVRDGTAPSETAALARHPANYLDSPRYRTDAVLSSCQHPPDDKALSTACSLTVST